MHRASSQPLPTLLLLAALPAAACDPSDDVTRAWIGPSGGTLRAPSGAVVLEVPPRALDEVLELSVRRTDTPADDMTGARPVEGAAYRFEPDGLRFLRPATLTLRHPSPSDPSLARSSTLAIAKVLAGGLRIAPAAVVERGGEQGGELHVAGLLAGFSDYTLVTCDNLCIPPPVLFAEPMADRTVLVTWRGAPFRTWPPAVHVERACLVDPSPSPPPHGCVEAPSGVEAPAEHDYHPIGTTPVHPARLFDRSVGTFAARLFYRARWRKGLDESAPSDPVEVSFGAVPSRTPEAVDAGVGREGDASASGSDGPTARVLVLTVLHGEVRSDAEWVGFRSGAGPWRSLASTGAGSYRAEPEPADDRYSFVVVCRGSGPRGASVEELELSIDDTWTPELRCPDERLRDASAGGRVENVPRGRCVRGALGEQPLGGCAVDRWAATVAPGLHDLIALVGPATGLLEGVVLRRGLSVEGRLEMNLDASSAIQLQNIEVGFQEPPELPIVDLYYWTAGGARAALGTALAPAATLPAVPGGAAQAGDLHEAHLTAFAGWTWREAREYFVVPRPVSLDLGTLPAPPRVVVRTGLSGGAVRPSVELEVDPGTLAYSIEWRGAGTTLGEWRVFARAGGSPGSPGAGGVAAPITRELPELEPAGFRAEWYPPEDSLSWTTRAHAGATILDHLRVHLGRRPLAREGTRLVSAGATGTMP